MSLWQPIESLPAKFLEPGNFVLLKGGRVVDELDNHDFPQPAFVVAERHHEWDEWVVAYYASGLAYVQYVEPTHWRTLESIEHPADALDQPTEAEDKP